MHKRRLLYLLFLAIFILVGVACGSETSDEPVADQEEAAAPAVEEAVDEAEEEMEETTEEEVSEEPEMADDKHGGTLTIIQRASPKSLVSIIDPGKSGIGILQNTQEGLLIYNESYTEVLPALAVDFPDHPDPLTYIFTLREGVKFHDGKEVTSADVAYTFRRLLDESYGATFGQVYRDNIESIDTPDPYTVIFHLKQDWNLFLNFVAGNHPKIVNEELAELPEYGKTVWSGTGPFMITEWVSGDFIRLERNPNYWGAGEENLPYLDEIIFRIIPEPSAMYAALETGAADVIDDPDFKDIGRFDTDPNFKVELRGSPASTVWVFNTARPPFDDQRLRLAVSKAIDRQEIVDALFFGYADAATDMFPPGHWAHEPNRDPLYDPEGAKALLADAGYDEDNPFTFSLMPRTEPVYADQATLVQAQLQRVGINMEIVPVEYTTLSGMTAGPADEWAGDAALYRITILRGSAFEFTYYQYGAEGALNRTYFNKEGGYQNPDFETLMQTANSYSDFDEAERAEAFPLYQELSDMWIDDAVGMILNWWANADIMQNNVMDWEPATGDIYTLKQVWLDKSE